jgi:hypothetical protein
MARIGFFPSTTDPQRMTLQAKVLRRIAANHPDELTPGVLEIRASYSLNRWQ